MKLFYDLKIASKLVTAFLIVLTLTSLTGIFSIYRLSAVSSKSSEIATNWLPAIKDALRMKVTLARYRLSELQHILASEDDVLLDEAQSLGVREGELKKYHDAYDALDASGTDRALSQQFEATLAGYLAEDKKVIELSTARKKEEARLLIRAQSTILYRQLNQQIDELVKRNEERGLQSAAAASTTYTSARNWIVLLLVGNLAIGIALAMRLSRIVSRPMNQAVRVATRVVQGDLTARIEATLAR